jgi:membrane-bound lytic murein transglycosylase D
MKRLKLLCLTSLLWLTGCATVSPTTPDTTDTAAKPAQGTPAPWLRRPVFPSGELQPIKPIRTPTNAVASLAPPADLWERIRAGFDMPDLEQDLVTDRETWYASRPDYILRMTERSRKYMFHIVEELERRGMPSELALLPFVESAFNPQAVSTAKAAGMWQFMPATGKYFELKQNAFRDDRRDVLESTRAALDYLEKLHGMFGDWHLALAAYNWGEGSVSRAIAKNKRAGLPAGYLDLNMPMETRFYVPKLQAIKNIVARPGAFNSKLPDIGNHPFFQMVDIQRDMDVALAAKLAEVSLEDFKALNPSINRPVILAAGTPTILLPWDNASVFQRNLQAYGGTGLASWTVWVAPRTMSPGEAAGQVNMSEAELRSVNHIPPRVVIKAGSSLLVPRSDRLLADVSERIAENGQVTLAPEIQLQRQIKKAGKRDSVASFAKRYKVSLESLAEWNKVSTSSVFKSGQKVVLYLPIQSSSRSKSSVKTKTRAKSASSASRVTSSKTSSSKRKPNK